MPDDRVEANRILLREVCALLAAHADDAVLIGGWVPDVRFPSARPPHIGSIDVDMLLRLRREQHIAVVELLLKNGFRQGKHRYQFWKDVQTSRSGKVVARLDLLTSSRHHREFFDDSEPSLQPVHGADIAFRDNAVLPIGPSGDVSVRVAGIAAFLTMKGIALHDRFPRRPKDAYDIHYCLEQYPDGITAIAAEFERFQGDELVRESMSKMAALFRDEEDEGPRMVADVEEIAGDDRAIRKLAVYTRVSEFLAAMGGTRPRSSAG
ncbi:MAG TPA: nucleotidyl transferase AbiEii/AbiGii toxin family protein [Opitutaceae bacterium]|nr:nucleotidyl transferase AbiEii/AbiGii toxin family protein [Opitutaceae bacterium]